MILDRAANERAREEGKNRGWTEPCGPMRQPFRVGDAGIRDAVCAAERGGRRCVGGNDDIDVLLAVYALGLTQLRERFAKERSTGMSRPDDERGQLNRCSEELERGALAEVKTLLHAPRTSALRKRLSSSRSVRSMAIGVMLTKPCSTAPISQAGSSLSLRPGRFQTR